MKAFSCIVYVMALQLFAVGAWSDDSPAERDYWHKSPTLSVMTGFIYEPKSSYTIQEWMENLGSGLDADQWVRDFQEVGAGHLVFYDKWIDGLVFHDTKTTGFKTKRDFLREIAAACQRGRLPLVIYFNAISDGNPEFDPWSLLGADGQPIVFSAGWPTRYQTLHSPFRAKCLEQVRELLTDYGPIHGIWHDIFDERLETTSEWTARGYQEMFGEPLASATPQRQLEFRMRTLAGYLDEVEAIRREQNQNSCLFTSNGSGGAFFAGGVWRETVGVRLQYLFNEGHSFAANEELARMAWALPKPLDINLLLNSTWFTPRDDSPPPSHLTAEQALAATAIAVCQGASVNLALTPGHGGTFGEDLQRAKAVGDWFRRVRPWLEEAQPYADVGIVPWLASEAMAAGEGLSRSGVFSRWTSLDQDTLAAYRAVFVPSHSPLSDSQVQSLRSFVRGGGTLMMCGDPAALADVCGVRVTGDAPFDASLQGAQVTADSQYSPQFAASNLLDEQPTDWASAGTPMPHWAEITLPEPIEVDTVELVSRAGGYLVTDFDIELPSVGGWQTAKSVRGADLPTVRVRLDVPATIDRLRVKVLRELYLGYDRQYADVQAIRLLDRAGRNRALGSHRPVRVNVCVAQPSPPADAPLTLPPSAVAVEPTTAEVVARFDNRERSPAILSNRFGEGRALLVSAHALPADNTTVWNWLRELALRRHRHFASMPRRPAAIAGSSPVSAMRTCCMQSTHK